MIEAAMIWNEPNNKSHWDPELDPDWTAFAADGDLAGQAIAAEAPGLLRVLGGISPIDPAFIVKLAGKGRARSSGRGGACTAFRWTGTSGRSTNGRTELAEIQAVTDLPVWVTEVGVSTFGAEEVQELGLQRTAELLIGRVPRIHWYSLYDLPRAWEATTRHREAEGSSYYRHFYMGLLREDGTPKLALRHFADYAPEMGLCQWFHSRTTGWTMRCAGCASWAYVTCGPGLSWADSFRPDALAWFDRQMEALEEFDVTVTFCFTPEHRGLAPHHTSPPQVPEEFAEFCAAMIRRYAA